MVAFHRIRINKIQPICIIALVRSGCNGAAHQAKKYENLSIKLHDEISRKEKPVLLQKVIMFG